MGLGEVRAHDQVGGVLVLVTLLELRLDAEMVECATNERRLHPHAEKSHSPAGLQPDLLKPGGQHVRGHVARALAEGLCPGDRRFAARGEGAHTKA